MDESKIVQLIDGIAAKQDSLGVLVKAMQDEKKSFGDATAETKAHVDGILTEINKMRDEQKELRLKLDTNAYGDGGNQYQTPGEQFTADEGYKSAVSRGLDRTGPVKLKKGFFPIGRKDITSAAASVGAGLPLPMRLPVMIANPHIPLRIRDLMNVVPTTATSIEYIKYTFTNNAAIVIDTGTTPATREGVLKPKSDMTMTKANATGETIAHWVAASKQVLADVPAIRGIIDGELMYGLKYKEEQEILLGDGTAGHLNGLYTQATAFNTALVGAGHTQLDQIRAAFLQGEIAQFPMDGIVLNPQDWYNIETLKDDLGRYLIGNPQGGINQTLWGLPVIKSQAMTAGNFLAGAFGMGATLFDREDANIEARDTHADFFVRNMVAILCEERLMLVVTRPQAFVKGTFA
jgi:HK97 family phage major capsid protein